MRHTLLPISERKLMRKEYRIRLVIVLCFVLSISLAIGIVSLFPTFISGYVEEKMQLKVVSAHNKTASDNKAVDQARELFLQKELISEIQKSGISGEPLSPNIEYIANLRGSIKISSVAVFREVDGKVSIVVQGLAPTRQSLISFKNRIESNNKNLTVNLPISQLAQSSNIRFSLQVNMK